MTLLEVLIAAAIASIVISLLYSIFFLGNKSFTVSKEMGFAQQDARLMSTVITKELRTAMAIEISNDLNSPHSIKEKLSNLNITEEIEYYSLEVEDQQLIKKQYNNGDPPGEKVLTLGKDIQEMKIDATQGGYIELIISGQEAQDKQILNIRLENKEIVGGTSTEETKVLYYAKYKPAP